MKAGLELGFGGGERFLRDLRGGGYFGIGMGGCGGWREVAVDGSFGGDFEGRLENRFRPGRFATIAIIIICMIMIIIA